MGCHGRCVVSRDDPGELGHSSQLGLDCCAIGCQRQINMMNMTYDMNL